MDELRDRARLVDASAFDDRGVTATVPRAEIESVLASADGPPELVLDIERRGGEEVEERTFRLEWDPKELEQLLQTTSGDSVTLVLDRKELERVIDEDVEAHGLRETAAVFAVAATAAASAAVGNAAMANAAALHDGGGDGPTPIAMVSDAGSGGPATTAATETAAQSDSNMLQVAAASQSAAQGPEIVSDAASTGPVTQAAAQTPELASDAATTGPVQRGGPQAPEIVSDAATTGPVQQAAAQTPELASDAATTGPVQRGGPQAPEIVTDAATTGPVQQPMTPQQIVDAAAGAPEMVSDAASSGPVTQAAAESSGGGWDISAPDAATTGAIAGAAALMIAGAAFAVRGQRRQVGHPA
jgi:hypothetical protein